MISKGETIGWWGCLSCGDVVRNSHTGPCARCGGRIGRIVPRSVNIEADLGLRPVYEPAPVAYVEPPRTHAIYLAIVAAAVLCIGSPLLGASSAGWNAVAIVMMVNAWSLSVGFYALSRVQDSSRAAYA